jgi:hypothetical protein
MGGRKLRFVGERATEERKNRLDRVLSASLTLALLRVDRA